MPRRRMRRWPSRRRSSEMLYLVAAYWQFLLIAAFAGIAIGWWYQDPRSADDVTAWLEREVDEP
jgi:hypothetical protein